MTCTYLSGTTFTDGDLFRFHTGDTDCTRQIFSDEEITAIIANAGTWQKGVILGIQSLIARMSTNPDFHADWLTVDYKEAIASFTKLLTLKARELGVPSGQIIGAALYIWRPDSFQTEEPTYPDDGPNPDTAFVG